MYPGWHYWKIWRTWISERFLLLTKIWVKSLTCNSVSELHVNDPCVPFNNVNQETSVKGFLSLFFIWLSYQLRLLAWLPINWCEVHWAAHCEIGYYTSNALKAVALQLSDIAHHSSYRDELPGTNSSRSGWSFAYCNRLLFPGNTSVEDLILNRDIDITGN